MRSLLISRFNAKNSLSEFASAVSIILLEKTKVNQDIKPLFFKSLEFLATLAPCRSSSATSKRKNATSDSSRTSSSPSANASEPATIRATAPRPLGPACPASIQTAWTPAVPMAQQLHRSKSPGLRAKLWHPATTYGRCFRPTRAAEEDSVCRRLLPVLKSSRCTIWTEIEPLCHHHQPLWHPRT